MFWRGFRHSLTLFLLISVVGGGAVAVGDTGQRVRAFTRVNEFDYVEWSLVAAFAKLKQAALGSQNYLDGPAQKKFVEDYLALVAQIQISQGELSRLYADPDQAAVAAQINELETRLDQLNVQLRQTAPLAEAIFQEQVQAVAADLGLSNGGQSLPPVFYRSTPLPWALIISPREAIQQEANISLKTEMTLEEHIGVEDAVAVALDVSTLVVPVGGVGTYPTMVAQSSDLNWLADVVAHEWIHNYLTRHPLGLLYDRNQDLHTMNETTASIAGKEIGAALIARFYPERVPPPPVIQPENLTAEAAPEAPLIPVFEFRSEMHATRVRVDELLAAGEVDEAEAYMETRRLFFWENGFTIRKLNQAYFAFYGSYADSPVGPAGADPVGEAVRELRARSDTLVAFLKQMAFLSSFEDLQSILEEGN